jgi:glutamate dehydrogenase/leucine dehydrogenase
MAEEIFVRYSDEYGPEKVCYIYEPRVGLKGIVVVDNTAAGPAIGGIRMAPDITTEEVFRLARAMTWKNALAGLPHGGGKSGIIADPKAPNKETLIRHFARGMEALKGYIPGPDMGTDETAMGWVRDEIGRSVGLSKVLGGIPLDQVGATGFGCAISAEVAQEYANLPLKGARICVQGFGNVGQPAARFFQERGAIMTIATDLDGTVYDPDGIDVDELIKLKQDTGRVTDYPRGQKFDDRNANIPCTAQAERILHGRGILSVPDFVANAGGVICASVEYHGGTQKQAFETIEEKIRENTGEVLKLSRDTKQMPMEAALALAKRRVAEAMDYRRHT